MDHKARAEREQFPLSAGSPPAAGVGPEKEKQAKVSAPQAGSVKYHIPVDAKLVAMTARDYPEIMVSYATTRKKRKPDVSRPQNPR